MSDRSDDNLFKVSSNIPASEERADTVRSDAAQGAATAATTAANVVRVHPYRRHGSPEAPGQTIAVICGGDGFQHLAAIDSGHAVAEALRMLGCRVVTVSVSPRLAAELGDCGASAVVPAVLDARLADGVLPDLCGDLGILCLGASGETMRACNDKVVTNARLAAAGILVPGQRLFTRGAVVSAGLGAILPKVVAHLGEHVYIKPRYGRGGAGVKRITGANAAAAAIVNAFSHGEDVVLERRVEGCELTILMTGDASEPMAVGVAEVTYDSEDRLAASWARHYRPAESLDAQCRRAVVSTARRAGLALGLDGLYTIDMIVDADSAPVVIEIDGMLDWRPTSAVGACLRSSDVTQPQLFAGLLRDAGAAMRRAA